MNALVINAAGKGTRVEMNIPKQFIDINGFPIMYWTVEKFVRLKLFNIIVIVSLPEYIPPLQKLFPFSYIKIIEGGYSCLRSRIAGLEYIMTYYSSIEKIMFHDSVRPFLSPNLIIRCLSSCNFDNSAVVPYISTVSTLKDFNSLHVPGVRKEPVAILQTPETFILRSLYDVITKIKNIDDYQTLPDLYEHNGNKCLYISGEFMNFKITGPDDLELAKRLFDGRLKY